MSTILSTTCSIGALPLVPVTDQPANKKYLAGCRAVHVLLLVWLNELSQGLNLRGLDCHYELTSLSTSL
jgi:hypothetical protein